MPTPRKAIQKPVIAKAGVSVAKPAMANVGVRTGAAQVGAKLDAVKNIGKNAAMNKKMQAASFWCSGGR